MYAKFGLTAHSSQLYIIFMRTYSLTAHSSQIYIIFMRTYTAVEI